MRVALIASGFPDYSLELASALADSHSTLVLADIDALTRECGPAPPHGRADLRHFRQAGRLRRWGVVTSLAATLARWRPDAILAHEHPHPHLSLLLRLAGRSAPLGLIVHDPEPHPGRDGDFARRRKHDITLQRALADHLFAHGAACAARLAQDSGRPVTPLLHGPILRPSGPPPPSPGRGGVLMFGRMESYKGLDVLLQAARLLQQRRVHLRLDLRGAGPELDRLHGEFRALPLCTVTPGHAPRAHLIQALADCDLVVAPYLQASASGVAAAALANGRGLVASAIGGLQDAVRPGVNGVQVPAGDPQALAEGLLAGLRDAQRLGGGSLSLAQGPFAWRHTADLLLAPFQSAAGRSRAA